MGDTTNWEFAAAVGAVCIGLGGLVLLAAISLIGSWRVFRQASRAAEEAAKASVAMTELAQQLAIRPALAAEQVAAAAGALGAAGERTDELLEKQQRLQEAVRLLVESGALQSDPDQYRRLESALRRLEAQLDNIAAAVGGAGRRQTRGESDG